MRSGRRLVVVGVLAAVVVVTAGCSGRVVDPGATRSTAKADALRDRVMTTQVDR